ncbi:MAG: EboA domain-containing protein [Spirulina sp.]
MNNLSDRQAIVDLSHLLNLLKSWLAERLPPPSWHWLEGKQQQIVSTGEKRDLLIGFSAVPRYVDKTSLQLTENDLQAIAGEEWHPGHWNLQQVARTFLLLSFPCDRQEDYGQALDQLFRVADVNELVTLYQSLPLLPYPESHIERAKDGIRTNMTSVFEALALRNPYPARYFDAPVWNQMVLKALFVDCPLHLILGLDRRLNPKLAPMAIDYARERRAAGRSVPPELWRLLGTYAGTNAIPDLKIALEERDPHQKEAAALACFLSTCQPVRDLLDAYPDLRTRMEKRELTWDTFSQRLNSVVEN